MLKYINIKQFIALTLMYLCFLVTSAPESFAQNNNRPKSVTKISQPKNLKCSQALLDSINSYLSNISSLRANFQQYDPATSEIQKGTVILQKPDKMRLEYTDPKHILVLAQKKDIIHYDYELEEKSFVSIDPMVAELLRHNQIKNQLKSCYLLDGNRAAVILKTGTKNQTSVKNDLSNTEIGLVFQTNPILLTKIERIENQVVEAEMELSNIKYDDATAEDFQFRDVNLYELNGK